MGSKNKSESSHHDHRLELVNLLLYTGASKCMYTFSNWFQTTVLKLTVVILFVANGTELCEKSTLDPVASLMA